MLNGVPGDWINCRNSLRLGHPLSPYLFIIVADLLQLLIRQNSHHLVLHHPIFTHLPPTTMQYVDDIDTLINAKATPAAATALRNILQDFIRANGLSINLSKSTFVPMNLRQQLLRNRCFAQSPPSPTSTSDYQSHPFDYPLMLFCLFCKAVATCKYLAGWKAKLLNKGDRLILLSALNDSLARSSTIFGPLF